MVSGLMNLLTNVITLSRTSSVGNNLHGPLATFNGYLAMRSGLEQLPNLFLLLGIMLEEEKFRSLLCL